MPIDRLDKEVVIYVHNRIIYHWGKMCPFKTKGIEYEVY